MRVLHVAALPFPSPQGTQALIGQMLRAHRVAGHDVHLLCYAHGDGGALPCEVHRIADFPRHRSLRSGPSLQKPLLDAQLAWAARSLCRSLQPDLIVAHHVEAALAVRIARGRDFVFYAHTDLAAELPSYARASLARPLGWAGGAVDRFLIRESARTLAVSPLLATQLAGHGGPSCESPAVPWPLAPAVEPRSRIDARRSLGFGPEDQVALYCGNLDAYQGLETWLEALSLLASRRPSIRWLVATDSETGDLRAELSARGLADRTRIVPLSGETRAQVHAACDVVVVTRGVPGGVPIKLLDALARGLPLVAVERAAAGLPIGEFTRLCAADALSFAEATERALDDPRALKRASAGREYVRSQHDPHRWLRALVGADAPGDTGPRTPRFAATSAREW